MSADENENVLSSSSKLATYNMVLQEPAPKKIRFSDKQASKESLKIHPILGDEYLVNEEVLGIVHGIGAKITSNRHTQEILKFLSVSLPLKNMSHVKRVRPFKHNGGQCLQILLFIQDCETDNTLFEKKFMDSKSLKIDVLTATPELLKYSEYLSDMFFCKVASKPALTREQFEYAKNFWPVTFHEDKYISKVIKGTHFLTTELENIKTFCEMVKTNKCDSMSKGKAVMVDSRTGKIIAKSVDMVAEKFNFLTCSKSFNHSLLHPAIVAIDLAAKAQGGGVYNYPNSNDLYWHKDFKTKTSKSSPSPESSAIHEIYICTGYDAYLTFEPCVMCSMALLHSRIRRVFYLQVNKKCGGLGGKYKLHAMRSLNHRFEAYWCTFET